jgi:hypothetical protein
MKRTESLRGKSTAVFVTLGFISWIPPGNCSAQQKKVVVEIGQPSVWSMAQAHYLLAKMHQANEQLKSRLPDEDDLDPNAANAFRLIIKLNSVNAEVQYDQSLGRMNQLAAKQYQSDVGQKQAAQNQVTQLMQTRNKLEKQLAGIDAQLAPLQSQAAPLQASTTPLTADQSQQLASLTQQIAPLNSAKASLTDQITQVNNDITTANTQATASVNVPTFQEPKLVTPPASEVPKSSAYDTFVANALKDFKSPNMDPHTALDNSVGMQYEIISKQLTLLRDEVGPNERVVFLELPASVYTVDGKADDYVVQLSWEVTEYFDDVDFLRTTVIPQYELQEYKDHEPSQEGKRAAGTIQELLQSQRAKKQSTEEKSKEQGEESESARDVRLSNYRNQPVTLEMILSKYNTAGWKQAEGGGKAPIPSQLNIRALDVIPRQSALNVNEYHANVSHLGILGAFKFLFGLGIQLDIQRQREVYEQFLQQEIFASGFGKGSNKFGWTFGPMPGSKRIAPGVKTTYAVLAIPRDTLAVKLKVVGKAYKKDKSPQEASPDLTFEKDVMVKIPGEET